MKFLIVGGTDTGVGKTIVTAALAAQAKALGRMVAVVKPAQTGLARGQSGVGQVGAEPGEGRGGGESGGVEPSDMEEVRRLSGVDDVHELARYPEPLAPATAAERVGEPGINVDQIVTAVNALDDRDLIIIEGAGGLLVRFSDREDNLIDLAAALQAPVVLVARAGLGTLNHSALSIQSLRASGVECPGLVIGAWPDNPDVASSANVKDLPSYCGAPLLGQIPEGAARLEPLEFQSQAQSWINSGGLL